MVGILKAASTYLAERGVEAPRLSMEWMIARILGMSRLEVYLAYDRPVSDGEKETLRGMVARRGKGEPLAYILGDQEFCGLEFRVTKDVLIPRPETEHLVTWLAERVPSGVRGVDLGTGSGAIAVALCHAREDLTMIATDASAAALAVAADNAERLGTGDRIDFREGSWWAPLADAAPLDFVVSNPPYVDPARDELLAADVAAFEPGLALFTPRDEPAAAYAAIVAGIEARLKPGALVLFETGVGADEAARRVLEQSDVLRDVASTADVAGLPRYLSAVVASPRG